MEELKPVRARPGTISRVLIIDDHPIVRAGLRHVIESQADLEVCGEARGQSEGWQAIRDLEPDVVVVDVSLEQGDGIDLVREVRAQRPGLPLLVLSMHDEVLYAGRLLSAGASGYLMKQAGPEQLLVALRQVLAGRVYLSQAMQDARQVAREAQGRQPGPVAALLGRLSNRELQVLNLLGRGFSSREAAESLNVSVKTIEAHRQALKRKLRLATNTQLLQYSAKWAADGGTAPPV